MIIDTHSHLNAHDFRDDFGEVIKRALEQNIWMINVGMDYETSKKAIEIAKQYQEGVFASLGLHPTDVQEVFDKERYKELAQDSKKVVAIGEIGLDYYYKPKTAVKLQQFKENQKKIFLEQLDLAKELDLPVILHCRVAHSDMLEILASYASKLRGVVHCFTGSLEEMKEYINLGFYIGFNGIIFKLPLDEVIKNCPLENMLVETDCPYLTPPQQKSTRNEPMFIRHTIEKIANIKGKTFEEICRVTTQNAKSLFGI